MSSVVDLILLLLCSNIDPVAAASDLLRAPGYDSRAGIPSLQESVPAVRGLLQYGTTADCSLEVEDIEDLLDPDRRVWLLDGDALSKFELQDIVDCTQEGDLLLFDVDDVVRPAERTTIPWNLTLSGVVDDTDLEKGVFPESESKVRITCPEDEVGVFFVESADVIFANIVFEECALNGTTASSIVEVGSCDSDEDSGTIRFHHVEFSGNSLTGAPGLDVSTEGCSSVEMIDVGFDENECRGNCGAVLSPKRNTLRNVRISNNAADKETPDVSAVIYCPPNSSTRAEDIVGSRNEVTVVRIYKATLDIRDSTFNKNKISPNSSSTSGLHLEASKAKIKNSEFGDNSGETGSSAITAISCASVEIKDCSFQSNNASEHQGAAVYSSETESLVITRSNFTDNIGTDGGAVYLVDTISEFRHCFFRQNNATVSGGGIHLKDSEIKISECAFLNNNATGDGGGVFAELSESTFVGITCRGNKADQGGCIRTHLGNVSVGDSFFEENNVTNRGGGIYATEPGRASIDGCEFVKNTGNLGGGAYVRFFSSVDIANSVFRDNNVSSNAGGLYIVDGTSFRVSSCYFESNTAAYWGGGFASNNASGILEDSIFFRNEANGGAGTLLAGDSKVTLYSITWEDNVADIEWGGGLQIDRSSGTVTNSIAKGNSADWGGGIFFYRANGSCSNVTFINNTGFETAGGLGTLRSAVDVTECRFEENKSLDGGGLYFGDESNATVSNCSVSNNLATGVDANGGGMYVDNSTADVRDIKIADNAADDYGGGIYSENSTIRADNIALLRNEAKKSGGCLDAAGNGTFVFTNSVFSQCRAEDGGAVAIHGNVIGTLSACRGYNSSAFERGGFAYVQEANLTIIAAEIQRCEAAFGGGIYLSDGWLRLNDSTLSGGSATVAGGAISLINGSYVIADNVVCRDNQAEHGGCLAIENSYAWAQDLQVSSCRAKIDGGGLCANESSSFLCAGCEFYNNSAGANGGGAYIVSKVPQLLAYQFDNTTFKSNRARLGGGINFMSESGGRNCSDPDQICTLMALRGTIFQGNDASAAGGSIMSSDLDSVWFSCSYDPPEDPMAYLTRDEYHKLLPVKSTNVLCEEWIHNKAESYGRDIASFAWGIKKYIELGDGNGPLPIDKNFYTLRDHRSGSPLPNLYFELEDQLKQGPAISLSSGAVTAKMTSPDELFEGSNEIKFTNGSCNFTGITIYKEAGLYNVVVDFSDPIIPQFSMTVKIRDCVIGEAPAENRVLCQLCNGDTYNLHPEREDLGCVPCPDHGNCSTRVIMPDRGYWHLSPCSVNIQECLSERACKDGSRYDDLKNITKDVGSCDFSPEFIADYMDAQCAEGYKGPLCGSCEASYGRSRAFRCEKCFGGFGKFVLLFITPLVLLLLSTFAIRSSLPSRRRRKRGNNEGNRNTVPESIAPESQDEYRARLADLAIHGRPSTKTIRRQREVDLEQDGMVAAVSETEIAKWKAVEIFKITINYLQVMAIAVSVNVAWNDALIATFETADFIGGVTSEAATRSVDCIVSDDSTISRSAVRTLASILVPLAVTGFWAVFWAAAMYRYQESMHYLSKRSILSICTVSYLSYIAVTKTAVNVLYCVDVYDSLDFESDATTAYWAVDTQLKCYKGSHAILAAVVGWPVIILFSLGFPVTVATLLINVRNNEGGQDEQLYESAGFLYRAYSSRFVFWESVIMLRKAVLVVVVVFAYPLGGNLQGVLAVCVLMMASYCHVLCSPFREELADLNQFEGLSLLVSSLTFASGLFFNDDHTTDAAKIMLATFVLFANISVFCFFVVCFFRSASSYIKSLLDNEELSYSQNGITLDIILVYIYTRSTDCFNFTFIRGARSEEP